MFKKFQLDKDFLFYFDNNNMDMFEGHYAVY